DTYHNYGLYGSIGRGELYPVVQEMPKYRHLVNLFNMCYDKGNRIVHTIQDRLGDAAFFEFNRHLMRRYRYRILRVADYKMELEAYTGRKWDEFFEHWFYGKGFTDWAVEKVTVEHTEPRIKAPWHGTPVAEAESEAEPPHCICTKAKRRPCK